jgi:protoporphyrin/coproporphyrin ferrochelatase
MMNLGGPKKSEDAADFMFNMFTDPQTVPIFKKVPNFIIRKFCDYRANKSVKVKYEEIGGGTPLYDWTHKQGEKMCEKLDQISPETAPHKYYIAFRYSQPDVQNAVEECINDGVERMVGFSQYPQYSCSTTNSSIQEFHKAIEKMERPENLKISLIDRWYKNEKYHRVLAKLLAEDFAQKFSENQKKDALILFTAHSLPQSFVDKGDTYPYEIYNTAHETMKILKQEYGIENPYRVVWQSRIGARWLSPSLADTIKDLPKFGWKNVLVSPLGFTSDHIETLHELDIELKEDAEKAGLNNLQRARSLNDHPDFIDTLSDIVKRHLVSNEYCTSQLMLRCPKCSNPDCNRLSKFYPEFK